MHVRSHNFAIIAIKSAYEKFLCLATMNSRECYEEVN